MATEFSRYSAETALQRKRTEGVVPVIGGNVSYEVIDPIAKGVPILFRHGGEGSSRMDFPRQYGLNEFFTQTRALGFYDSIGSGKSDRPDDLSILTPERAVDEADTLIRSVFQETLGHEGIIFAGDSCGGAVGLMLALRQPSYLRGLILMSPLISIKRLDQDIEELLKRIDPNNPNFRQDLWHYEQRQGSQDNPLTDEEKLTFEAMQNLIDEKVWLGMDPRNLPPDLKASWYASYLELNPEVTLTTMGSHGKLRGTWNDVELGEQIGDINLPTLLIVGSEDQNLGTVEESAPKFKDAEVVILEDAAHLGQYSHPKKVNEAITEWVERKIDRAA